MNKNTLFIDEINSKGGELRELYLSTIKFLLNWKEFNYLNSRKYLDILKKSIILGKFISTNQTEISFDENFEILTVTISTPRSQKIINMPAQKLQDDVYKFYKRKENFYEKK